MFYKSGSQPTDVRINMRGGEGKVGVTPIADVLPKNVRLAAHVELGPGDSIGEHSHVGETEIFYVLSGELEWTDGDAVYTARPGDALYTGNGARHSVRNISGEPTALFAVIVSE